ncbi:unnamed protein product [Trichobilharzia regenti]|nr:unnamed protein product [Trichobilharzia regenti]
MLHLPTYLTTREIERFRVIRVNFFHIPLSSSIPSVSSCFTVAASLKDSRILFNFGEEQPLEFPPGGVYVPVAQSSDDSQVPNRNPGWRMNQYDATNALDVAPDGSQVQSHYNQGWQGCRSNHVSNNTCVYINLYRIGI